MEHAAVALYRCLVVELVHVHQVDVERTGDALLYLNVDVLIVHAVVAPLPEGRTVAVSAGTATVDGVALDTADVREVHAHVSAVLTAEQRVALEVVTDLGLVSPLAVWIGGVGIHGGQGVGLIHSERGQVVDERSRSSLALALAAAAAERHVVAALSLEQEAHTTLRVRRREHGNRTLTINPTILICRVLRLPCVFGQEVEAALLQVGPYVERIDGRRHVELMGSVSHYVVSLFILVHP